MSVSIITHVYGPFYASLLAEQLRSLVHYRDLARVTVLHAANESHLISVAVEGIQANVVWRPLELPQLLNRNIGRNMAALATEADWVWFADADYLFGPGSLEAVAALDRHAACMYWPSHVLRPVEGEYYDGRYPDAAGRCTVPSRVRKAIGGCQIVPGHLARTYGYLDGVERYLRPARGAVFEDTRGDGAYRGWLADKTGLPLLAADIPNVCRLRHRIPKCNARHRLLPMEAL